jgi:hypothetical protein
MQTSASQQQEGREEPRRAVVFYPSVCVQIIPNLNTFSKGDIASIWMNKEDYQRTRREAQETVDMLAWTDAETKNGDDESHCLLGLDGFCHVGKIWRRAVRSRAWKSVFREQSTQCSLGRFSDDLIAMFYKEHSDKAQQFAHQRALENARKIQEYLADAKSNNKSQ